MTQYILRNNTEQHLCDQTELTVFSREVKNYLMREWFTDAQNAGLKKVAILVSKNAFGDHPEEENHETRIGKLRIFTSTSNLNCIDWLKEN